MGTGHSSSLVAFQQAGPSPLKGCECHLPHEKISTCPGQVASPAASVKGPGTAVQVAATQLGEMYTDRPWEGKRPFRSPGGGTPHSSGHV